MGSLQRRSHVFSQVPQAEIARSVFDRSHGVKTTFNAGDLVPIFVDEVLPGDTFNLKARLFARLATPLFPFMDNLFIETFWFFIPNRLVWIHWEKFNGAQDNPGDSVVFTVPQTTVTAGFAAGSLYDYFGIPTVGGGGTNPPNVNNVTVNNLVARCYNLVWNTWFRDENLQNSVTVDTGDGPDTASNYVILKRGKRHDYFNSALPWTQKGTAVTLPLGTYAPVYPYSPTNGFIGPGTQTGANAANLAVYGNFFNTTLNAGTVINSPAKVASTGSGQAWITGSGTSIPASNFLMYPTKAGLGGSAGTGGDWGVNGAQGYLAADLNSATAATINQIRQAFQIQRMYERDARGGTRYTEIIRAHFGVTSPDARLQRPEFLGFGRQNVNLHAIPQTSPTGIAGTTTHFGDLSAFGTSTPSGNHGFTKSFTEHGHIIGLVNARSDMNYQQGLNRMWSRQTRLDFFWPALARLGEQSVLNQELWYQDNVAHATDNAAVFGYQERYAEYRYKPSQITGQYRSNFTTPLDAWHLAFNFASLPALNASFIQDAPPMSRVKAVTSAPDFLLDVAIDLLCARPMPVYGIPGDIDRF